MQMQINRKRLEESMAALGRIGETPAGGLSRLGSQAGLGDDFGHRGLSWSWTSRVRHPYFTPTHSVH